MKIGTRKSRLAMVQTEMTAAAIRAKFPDLEIEIEGCETKGDRQLGRSLSDFGGKGAFTQDLERQMMAGEIDIAVHSAKDMPLELPEGLCIAAVLKREDQRDVWVSTSSEPLAARKTGTVVGTGSRRRAVQVRAVNADVQIADIRGNVPTRLKKMSDGLYDGVILAAAGLKRLGYIAASETMQGSFDIEDVRYYYEYLPADRFLPAAGQGIIAIEAREKDRQMVCDALNDESAWLMLLTERAFLKRIGGSCNEAVGIYTRITEDRFLVKAGYAGDDDCMHTVCEDREIAASAAENRLLADKIGSLVAERILAERKA